MNKNDEILPLNRNFDEKLNRKKINLIDLCMMNESMFTATVVPDCLTSSCFSSESSHILVAGMEGGGMNR